MESTADLRGQPRGMDENAPQCNGTEELIVNKRRRYTRDLSAVVVDGQVGSGVYGTVFKAHDPASNEQLALKMIKMSKEKDGFPVTALREIKILKAINHENIINLHEVLTYNPEATENSTFDFEDGAVFMVFDYMDFDLSGLMSSVTLSSDQIRSYMKQILSGIFYIHKCNILHRDIKGANILVSRDNRVKIGDWGLSRSYYSKAQRLSNPVVTLWYRSPELLLESRDYGTEIDIWSVGCLFGEMLGRPPKPILPADPPTSHAQLEMIYRLCGSPTGAAETRLKACEGWANYTFTTTYPCRFRERFASLPLHAVDLLELLLDLNPDTRISAKNALDHSYFWSPSTLPPERLPPIASRVEGAHEYETMKKKQEERAQRSQQSGRGGGREGGRGIGGRGVGVGGRSRYRVTKPQSGPSSRPAPPAVPPPPVNVEAATGDIVDSGDSAFKKAPTAIGYKPPPDGPV